MEGGDGGGMRKEAGAGRREQGRRERTHQESVGITRAQQESLGITRKLQIMIIITSELQIIIIIISVLQIVIIIIRNCQSLDSSSFFIGLCFVNSPVQGCYSLSISLELTTSFFKKCHVSEKHRIIRQQSDEIRIVHHKVVFSKEFMGFVPL